MLANPYTFTLNYNLLGVNVRLAESIAQDRQRLGLSQQQVADACGVSQQSVAKWEAGSATPRGKRRDRLVSVLGKKSQTAAALESTLHHVGSNKGIDGMMLQQTTSYQQTLAQIARAAEELARAAQAIAASVERLNEGVPQPTGTPAKKH